MTSEKRAQNSILMTPHYPDLGSAPDWLNEISHAARPIRSTNRIWEVTRHHYGIFALVSQTSFGGETSGRVAKCRLFSEANLALKVRKNGQQKTFLCSPPLSRVVSRPNSLPLSFRTPATQAMVTITERGL